MMQLQSVKLLLPVGPVRLACSATKTLALSALLLGAVACEKAPPPPATSEAPAAPPPVVAAVPTQPVETAPLAQPAPPPPPPVVIPAGTRISVLLDSSLGSKTSAVGDHFNGTLASAVRIKGVEVLHSHAAVVGEVTDAKAAGKFAGASSLGLRLDSVEDHAVMTTAYSQHTDGKGKRTAEVIGGTALAGALLGGLAGHGKGALIGAAAGGGIGTLGAAETGNNRDIVLPAGSVVTFALTQSLTIERH